MSDRFIEPDDRDSLLAEVIRQVDEAKVAIAEKPFVENDIEGVSAYCLKLFGEFGMDGAAWFEESKARTGMVLANTLAQDQVVNTPEAAKAFAEAIIASPLSPNVYALMATWCDGLLVGALYERRSQELMPR